MTAVQSLITDGLAVTVGDNPSGQDALLKLADPDNPAAMTIATSAALGTVINVARRRADPRHHERRRRRRADARTRGRRRRRSSVGRRCTSSPTRATPRRPRRGTSSSSCTTAQSQSTWAAATGYVPIREDALELDPVQHDVRHRSPVQGRLRAARRRRRTTWLASDRCSGRCARCAPSPPAPWRRSSAAPTSPPRSPPPPPSPTPSSPTTTPATDAAVPPSGRDPSQGGIRPGIRDRTRPDRSAFPFPVAATPMGGVDLPALDQYAAEHHGLVTRQAAERRGLSWSAWYRALTCGAARGAAPGRRPARRQSPTHASSGSPPPCWRPGRARSPRTGRRPTCGASPDRRTTRST